jgi:uncharacterized membrane protein
MASIWKLLFSVLLIILVSAPVIVQAQLSSVDTAQNSVNNAYKAILDACNAGADTNQLIEQLNQAINLTSQAQQLLNKDSQQADALASQAQAIAQNVTQQATTTQQSGSTVLPIIAIATAAALIVAGIITYAFGPKVMWKMWFKLRKNYHIKTKNSLTNNKSLVITAEQLCAIILGVTIILAFISVSGFLLPSGQGEQFSELGVLGPNMKLGDYPSQVVASETVHLYVYVGNQMGQPMYYTVMVKLGNNDTVINPASIAPIQQYSQVIPNNQTWTFPVDITLTKLGVNQRIVFELWIYNQTINQNQYHERWGQIWLNVTAPAS